MKHIILIVLTSSLFTACMTQADKALWLEAKNTLGGKSETVAAEAPQPTAEAKGELKTSKTSLPKDEVAPAAKDEGLAPKAKAN